MSESHEQLWRDAARETFLRWDVARRAVEEQWAGSNSLDLILWMAETVADYFLQCASGAFLPCPVYCRSIAAQNAATAKQRRRRGEDRWNGWTGARWSTLG